MILFKGKLSSLNKAKTGFKISFFIKWEDIENLETAELELEQAVNGSGWITFTADKLKAKIEEIMKTKTIGAKYEGKSMSEQQRGVLFEYWTKVYMGTKTFEEFYTEKMLGNIQKVKNTIAQIEADQQDKFYNH